MKQETTSTGARHVPRWQSPDDARAKLEQIIENFIGGAACSADKCEHSSEALALKVTAGLGKTATALRKIAEHGPALLAQGHVLVYTPTLDLAERAHRDFLALAPDLPSRVIRGRDALRPESQTTRMCERADLAKQIAGFVPSVTHALCRAIDAEGKFVQASCASACPYLAQKDIDGPHVLFLAHAYLTAGLPIGDDDVVLRIIDEKVWPALTRISSQPIEEFMRAPSDSFPEDLRSRLSEIKALVVDGLQRNLPLHEHVRRSGIKTESIIELVEAERESRSQLDISPEQDTDTIEFWVNTFDHRAFIASRRRERVFSLLCEKETGTCNFLRLVETGVDGASRQTIQAFTTDEMPRDAPLLLLDADADPDITEQTVPGADFVGIDSPPVADIVQVADRTLSDTWLLDENAGAARRASVLQILEREVGDAHGSGVLIVATKAVLRALHEDVYGSAPSGDSDLRKPLLGAVPRWFGPRMQGVNDFESYAAMVVVGRLQPRISDVENLARAVFGRAPSPIVPHANGPLPAKDALYLMRDASEVSGRGNMHPDSRVQAILEQTRECGTLQAIARLRLVAPQRAKRVVILSNLPLPGFPITRLVTLDTLARGLEHEPDPDGYFRMETALRAIRDRPVCGTRLSASGLAADLPRDFVTIGAARRFRRGRTTEHLVALCKRIANGNSWPLTQLLLRKPEGGKPTPAILLLECEDAKAKAAVFWPELNATRDG
jgi:hypothetical protein